MTKKICSHCGEQLIRVKLYTDASFSKRAKPGWEYLHPGPGQLQTKCPNA